MMSVTPERIAGGKKNSGGGRLLIVHLLLHWKGPARGKVDLTSPERRDQSKGKGRQGLVERKVTSPYPPRSLLRGINLVDCGL